MSLSFRISFLFKILPCCEEDWNWLEQIWKIRKCDVSMKKYYSKYYNTLSLSKSWIFYIYRFLFELVTHKKWQEKLGFVPKNVMMLAFLLKSHQDMVQTFRIFIPLSLGSDSKHSYRIFDGVKTLKFKADELPNLDAFFKDTFVELETVMRKYPKNDNSFDWKCPFQVILSSVLFPMLDFPSKHLNSIHQMGQPQFCPLFLFSF